MVPMCWLLSVLVPCSFVSGLNMLLFLPLLFQFVFFGRGLIFHNFSNSSSGSTPQHLNQTPLHSCVFSVCFMMEPSSTWFFDLHRFQTPGAFIHLCHVKNILQSLHKNLNHIIQFNINHIVHMMKVCIFTERTHIHHRNYIFSHKICQICVGRMISKSPHTKNIVN